MTFGFLRWVFSHSRRPPLEPKRTAVETVLTEPVNRTAKAQPISEKLRVVPSRLIAAKTPKLPQVPVSPKPKFILTPDQENALTQIKSAYEPGGFYLLTGHAGSGKTTLVQSFTEDMLDKGRSVILSAPTHKAVAVLAQKLKEAHIGNVTCRTIHSVLGLKPKNRADQKIFERDRNAKPVLADVVVIDECSMVSKELYRHIKRNLPNAFVLFVGDSAQLPPVGEAESQTFSTKNSTHLTSIVRVAGDNPVLKAARLIRASQGGPSDISWCKTASLQNGHGVFLPRGATEDWMRKGFTSAEFQADPDNFRYLAWTNRRVDEVNEMIRRWRYGEDIPTPFMPGERCLFKEPLVINEAIIFLNNQEAEVLAIERGNVEHKIANASSVTGWTASLQTWKIRLRDSDGSEKTVHMPADNSEYQRVINRIRDEAAEARIRWKHLHEFQESLAQLQSIYALTVHRSQGSTFGTVFVDMPDIRHREQDNLLEAQQLLYVAVTRASKRVIVVGM